MILANVRGRLRAADFRLVALALARGDATRRARYERLLLEQGPDRLLDERGLFEALLALRTLVVPSPALFTYVAVRHTLLAAGVDDRELADYLAALILEFGDHDRHTRIRRADDQTYAYLVDMIGELTGVDDTGERGFPTASGSRACSPTTSRPGAIAREDRTCRTTTSSAARATGSPPSTAWRSASAWPESTARRRSGSPRSGSPSTG